MSPASEVIERSGTSRMPFLERLPAEGTMAFRTGATIVVGEDEAAVMLVDGRAADGFGPGRHVLSTNSLPLATRVLSLPYGTGAPFESAICFVREGVTERHPWGTRIPVAFRDNMFGIVRIRGFGTYTARITNPPLFLNTVVGPATVRYSGRVDDILRDLVGSRFADYLSGQVDTVIDLPRYADQASAAIEQRLMEDFRSRGLSLVGFRLCAFTVQPEVLEMLETRRSIAAVAAVCDYFRSQAAQALAVEPETDSESGERRPAVVSQDWMGADPDQMQRCGGCHALMPGDTQFCSRCGSAFFPRTPCLACGQENPPEWDYCMACGHPRGRGQVCRECKTEVPMGSRFCMACGNPACQDEQENAA